MNRTLCLAVLVLSLPSAVSFAQTPSAVIREGDVLTGAPPGHLVTSLSGTNINDNGGYVVQLNSSDGVTTLSHCWGTGNGTSPMILQTEATYGSLVQTSFEGFLGIANDASVAYSASGTGGPVGGFDSVWLNSTPIAVEGDPIPSIPGKFFRFGSRPGVTGDGIPYFVGGITSTAGGTTESYALFYGMNPVALLQGGDSVPNLPEPLGNSSSVSFDYRMSTLGTNYIVEVTMAGPTVTSSNDNAMVFSGAGLMLGGSLVQEGALIPMSIGGDGSESWDNFDYCGIIESGSYVFTGDTDADSTTDEIVVVDGLIRYREGDVIDGQTVSGSIESASMNENGQLVFIWDVAGGSLEALFTDDDMLLVEGDEVDWDGDGTIDAGHVITDFTGIAALSLGSDAVVYFTADVDTAGGGVFEGLFALPLPPPATCQWYCGTGVNAATDGYVITDPAVLGGTFGASVTGCSGTSTGALLVGYSTSLTLASIWGEILVNFADPHGELLGTPSAAGNPAAFSLPVPNDPLLSGLVFYTQAVSFGGAFCLHCAHACTLGS